jgi:hypothetical protein
LNFSNANVLPSANNYKVARPAAIVQAGWVITLKRYAPTRFECHGGLVAHNIDYDMVSYWETMGFGRFVRQIMRDIRHDNLIHVYINC